MRKRGLLAVAAVASLGLCAPAHADADKMSKPMGFDRMVDPAISPCSDFFHYVCKQWIDANPIPDDQARWGQFFVLREENLKRLQGLLDAVPTDAPAPARRAGDFYAACMDENGIEAKGIDPLKPVFADIDGLADKQALVPLLAKLHEAGISAFFAFGSGKDPNNSDRNIAAASQSGLGLPDRDFYFRKDEKAQHQREAYVAHIAHMFTLAGETQDAAEARANSIMTLETALAEISLDRVAMRDPQKTNKPMAFAAFEKEAPGIDWAGYLKAIEVTDVPRINNQTSDYFAKVGAVIDKTSMDDIKSYLRWHVLHSAAPILPKAFVQENFEFYGHTLAGTPALQPRWKRCAQMTDHALGEDLGQMFVAKYYPPSSKARTAELIEAVHASYGRIIAKVDWMEPVTKARAEAKLKAMANKIGYPDKWRDYSSVTITRDDAFGNRERASAFEVRRDLKKIGTPVDRSEWDMTPPTVNAYYAPDNNDINFPAGILQFPFFEADADDAVNFGAIGMVIGHEMTHGFDDEGRQYDAKGNLADWWTKTDATKFEKKSQCLVNEYGSFHADADVTLNGKLTLGENTADNGGARIAYWALEKILAGKKVEKIDGFTPEQRFFMGMARIWCGSERPEARRLQAQTDPHSLAEFRVNGVVANMPEFAKAFHCKPGDAMVSKTACKVW